MSTFTRATSRPLLDQKARHPAGFFYAFRVIRKYLLPIPALRSRLVQVKLLGVAVILMKTEAGLLVMKDRSVAMSPRQRSAFILFDGKRTLDGVLAATAATGVSRADVERLVALGLLCDPAVRAGSPEPFHADTVPAALAAQEQPERPPQQRYADAYPIAIQLTSGMGLRGLRLNQAVEGACSYEQLLALAPKIREAVGPEKFLPLGLALHDA